MERYFQLARCYRDEGGRADRQPEFTQIDLEMAFVSQRNVMDVVEGMIKEVWRTARRLEESGNSTIGDIGDEPFPVMTYDQVLASFMIAFLSCATLLILKFDCDRRPCHRMV